MEGIDWASSAYQACAMAADGDLAFESAGAGHGNSASTIAYHIRPDSRMHLTLPMPLEQLFSVARSAGSHLAAYV